MIDWDKDSYIVVSEEDTSMRVESGLTKVSTPSFQSLGSECLLERSERAFFDNQNDSYVQKREVWVPNIAGESVC